MIARPVLGVFISGRGSNLRAILEAVHSDVIPADIGLVLSSREQAAGLDIFRKSGAPAVTVKRADYVSTEAYVRGMNRLCVEAGLDYIALAGFMSILPSAFVCRWWGKLVNIHPAPLPGYPGRNVHQRVIDDELSVTEACVHWVAEAVDAGPVIDRALVQVQRGDTAEILANRVLKIEHELYPRVLARLVKGELSPPGSWQADAD